MRWLEYGTCIIVTHLDEGEAVEIPIPSPVKLWAKYPPTAGDVVPFSDPPRVIRIKADRRFKEIDCGVIHGYDAGRITVHERDNGKWAVIWHPVRGRPESLAVFPTEESAVEFGWKEYDARS